MGIVKALALDVYSKIAAGEVVERPLSVVKELIENSIDAGAQNIRVDLLEGGKKSIRVRDDGTGFLADDILPAFTRHATSKIIHLEDFDHLNSLGFRGEALPSISQVAQIILQTSTDSNGLGWRVRLDESGEIERESVACTKGSDITVNDLFYNFPVRKKFLKSERTELNAILRYLEQLVLAYWQKGFSLFHNGRELLALPAVSTLEQRIYQVFGKEFVDGLRPLENARQGNWRISGWVSKSKQGGHDRQRQFFFVNGRNVKEKTIMAAFNQAYKGVLEKEHQPQGILLIEIPPHEIDVNIHPMKLEIKFADTQAVFSWIYRSITQILQDTHHRVPQGYHEPHPSNDGVRFAGQFGSSPTNAISGLHASESRPLFSLGRSSYQLLGQYQNSYIVIEKGGHLLLVDQHNAHERVIFERLTQNMSEHGSVASVMSLFPIICELSPLEWENFLEKGNGLSVVGFDLEPLGGRSVSIRSYPSGLTEQTCRDGLSALLSDQTETDEPVMTKRLATIACKSAIKVNHVLNSQEMVKLLDDLFTLDHYDFCPHGRPIIVTISADEVEKRLKRR